MVELQTVGGTVRRDVAIDPISRRCWNDHDYDVVVAKAVVKAVVKAAQSVAWISM